MYEFWLFVHVLMAITWVGGNVALNVVGTRLNSANDTVALASFARQIEWIGTRVFTPASLLLLAAGIIMTLDAWDFQTTWIIIGMAGFAYSLINGAAFNGPLSGKTSRLAEERVSRTPRSAAT